MRYISKTTVILRYAGNKEWLVLHPHKVNGDFPVLMNRIPDCGNFDRIYPGCEREKDNLFQSININLSKGEKRMKIWNIISKSQGWTTHAHAQISIGFCVLSLLSIIVDEYKIACVLIIIAIGNIAAALGCMRQKLQAMSEK